MSDPTNSDLHRDFGRMEGELVSMKGEITEIKIILSEIRARLGSMETKQAVDHKSNGNSWKMVWACVGAGWTLFVMVGAAALNHYWK